MDNRIPAELASAPSIRPNARHESRRSGRLLLLILAVAAAFFAPRSEAATLAICANQPVPAGYVITALGKTAACGGGLVAWNTMTLTAYQGLKSVRACAPLPNIPAGYIVTAQTTTPACKGGQGALVPWNTMTLTAYGGLPSFNACMPLPAIPPGYVVTARIRTNACSGPPGPNTVTLKRL